MFQAIRKVINAATKGTMAPDVLRDGCQVTEQDYDMPCNHFLLLCVRKIKVPRSRDGRLKDGESLRCDKTFSEDGHFVLAEVVKAQSEGG
jgi:hypothetical protein